MSISIFILFICLQQCLQGELTKKQSEELEEIREIQREKDLIKGFSFFPMSFQTTRLVF